MPAAGRVDQQIANAVEAMARFGRAPHDHFEHLLFLVQVPDHYAGHQGCCCAPHVARFEAMALRCGDVDLGFKSDLLDRKLDVRRNDAGDPRDGSADFLRPVAEANLGLAIDACDDPVLRSRHCAFAHFAQVGLHPMLQPGVAIDNALDRSHRPVVIGFGIDAHPELGGMHVDGPISQHGAADVGRDATNPGDGPQLASDPTRDPRHLRL